MRCKIGVNASMRFARISIAYRDTHFLTIAFCDASHFAKENSEFLHKLRLSHKNDSAHVSSKGKVRLKNKRKFDKPAPSLLNTSYDSEIFIY